MSAQHGTSSNDDRFQAGEDRMSKNHFAGQRGFTLSEVAVASLIFLFVAVAAFKALTESSQVYKRGNESAEMQQRTRMAFDQMMTELRLAGFDYNRDGEENVYPDHPDEQLEWIGGPTQHGGEHLTINEARQRYLGGKLSKEWWYCQVREGKLPSQKAGGSILLLPTDIERFVAAMQSDDEGDPPSSPAPTETTAAPDTPKPSAGRRRPAGDGSGFHFFGG